MTNRTNVGVMMAGQGATGDVFGATEQFLKVCARAQYNRVVQADVHMCTQEPEK